MSRENVLTVPSLDQIWIYPIKSCSGIHLNSSEVEDRGFPLDRRWLLIEENGTFISQRNSPKLGQIKISYHQDHLHITSAGKDALTLEFSAATPTKIEAQIWKDTVQGSWISKECDAWFSDILNRPVRLVHMNSEVHRPLENPALPSNRTFEVSFADGYPYLLTNQASLDDLNGRLDQPIPMDRFRSNLVVSGFEAFAEDSWKRISIGAVEFLVVKPCARCLVTTIDQESGIASKEPLKTLATYRKQNGKVNFGMNLIALTRGVVSRGDPLDILEQDET
jgi:uncharacterized protein